MEPFLDEAMRQTAGATEKVDDRASSFWDGVRVEIFWIGAGAHRMRFYRGDDKNCRHRDERIQLRFGLGLPRDFVVRERSSESPFGSTQAEAFLALGDSIPTRRELAIRR